MGKARNLGLAFSIAAVQEGKTLFTFFFSKKFYNYEVSKKSTYLLVKKRDRSHGRVKIWPCPLLLLQYRHFSV
jgi:hypothetical protein